MQLHTFTARSLPAALRLIRQTLGPDASLLHTRDVTPRLSRWLGRRTIEVTATADDSVPTRLAHLPKTLAQSQSQASPRPSLNVPDSSHSIRKPLPLSANTESSLVERLADRTERFLAASS